MKFSGKVVNSNNCPIEGVVVCLVNSNGDSIEGFYTNSGGDGECSLSLPSRESRIRFSKDGFVKKTVKVSDVENGSTILLKEDFDSGNLFVPKKNTLGAFLITAFINQTIELGLNHLRIKKN